MDDVPVLDDMLSRRVGVVQIEVQRPLDALMLLDVDLSQKSLRDT